MPANPTWRGLGYGAHYKLVFQVSVVVEVLVTGWMVRFQVLFPTSAVLRGFVKRDGKPVANVRVEVDGRKFVLTDRNGKFLFEKKSV
ncbi:MAG: hypothetical protein DRP85_04475 [Candidatus Makaraimicrobium thalassicum]|nr:MAG: hypothetical protein DRP85_04475 [Candidatus Omnitrophota bacterium]